MTVNEPVARWEGFNVRLDGTAVRFGDGEHWVRPYPSPRPGEEPQLRELFTAFVGRDGRALTVVADDYNFIFYAVTREDFGPVFHYRCRKRRMPYLPFARIVESMR